MFTRNDIDTWAGKYTHSRWKGIPARQWLSRRFSRFLRHRVLICYNDIEVSPAQVYPFFHYAREFRARYGAEFRCVRFNDISGQRAIEGPHRALIEEANVIILQPWFTIDHEALLEIIHNIIKVNPKVEISFLDSYAHSDIRLISIIDKYIKFYVKKSIFKDVSNFRKSFKGGTNLSEYYSDLYNIPAEIVDWNVPPLNISKLKLSPNFLTARRFVDAFNHDDMPKRTHRTLDVHARIGQKGTAWYEAMRSDAIQRIRNITNLTVSPVDKVSRNAYMTELSNCKLCFSPFGYGELCWRDIEAFQAGAVLVKPDMSHLNTLPDLYEPDVTYLPCAWDFSDLEEVVHNALADEDKCLRIANTAFNRSSSYIADGNFVDDMSFLFLDS